VNLWQAIVIGIVQGLTEFLPVSSTAHMRIVPALLGWNDPGAAFSAVIQIGTLVAVLGYFWRDVVRIVTAVLADLRHGRFASNHESRMGWMIVVGTIPIVVVGLLFKHQIKTSLRSLYVISVALIVVALLLAVAELFTRFRRVRGIEGRDISQTGWLDAIVVGLTQATALVPGTSRSGATILGGLCCGLTRETAARFSFLLSIPSIFAAGVFELIEARKVLLADQSQTMNLVAALVTSGVVGYASIPWLLGFLKKNSTFVFIIYRIVLACVLLALLANGRISDSTSNEHAAQQKRAFADATHNG
jgi:undecaprenyl-diphosphatase